MTNNEYEIIRKHQEKAPVDVLAIARDLEIEVFEDDELPSKMSGLLSGDDDGYYIIVNAKHHPNRQRFTIAHEIAHFVLHRDSIGDGIQDNALYRSHLSGRQETEANKMAADILMPWELIDEIIENSKRPTVEGLAKKLRVSRGAMSIRLGVPLDD